MKPKETSLNSPLKKINFEDLSDDHYSGNPDTPLRSDAFDISDEKKIELIQQHIESIMHVLGLDLTDDSLKGTPLRVAKMYVQEVFSGLNPQNKPDVKMFENKYRFNQMLLEKDITFYSHCEHHLVPFFGKAHVAYIPSDAVVGLSKINRIVQYYARRPQVQERLTIQIANEMKTILNTEDVAVVIEASHLCVASRGVKDTHSSTITHHFSGKFQEKGFKDELIAHIHVK